MDVAYGTYRTVAPIANRAVRSTLKYRPPNSGKDFYKVGKTQKQTAKKTFTIVGVVLFVLALGVVGQWDYEYETRASVCREYNGSTVCYQP